ncbi:MAG: polyribonucleotide nucleotidyltransferase [Deltaproteobacteria bacterium]|nr:polyribonucleotide nucleotidyltransferase [Deltaproteobacteria bacterium]
MAEPFTRTITFGSKDMTFDVGYIAKQAHGSAYVSFGDTVVLATACAAPNPRPNANFLPLTCDYIEKTFAAGMIPGGFYKREGRPRDHETLMSRIIDRSIRPLFPETWRLDTQVIATVLSFDPGYPSDVAALNGASLALTLSDIPFAGPIGSVRVGRVDGKLVANPSQDERAKSELDLFVACSRSAITMVEGGAAEVSESVVVDALLFAHQTIIPFIDLQLELQKQYGKPKRPVPPIDAAEEVKTRVNELGTAPLMKAIGVSEKHARYAAIDVAEKEVHTKLEAEWGAEKATERSSQIAAAFEELKWLAVRRMIVHDGIRIGGRKHDEIRDVTCAAGLLPRVHGSALFQRGETQAVVTTTLGTRQDEQRMESLEGSSFKRFLLHYNFPPYSVGEVKPLRSPGRREIGHGSLAERALERLMPSQEDFPYVIRIVSEVTESNGSSSMATVCGGTLSMLDAGVPMKAMAAGIAMGLIEQDGKIAILSDILGDEDHLGDMDFKVCGTRNGITAVQMDIKLTGVSRETLERALDQARRGRLHILDKMSETLSTARPEISKWAPRITKLKIKVEKIKDVIGPGGKVIKDIIAKTGVSMDVDDDGTVSIASSDASAVERALRLIKDITREPEVDKIYLGTVRKVAEFGAFVEIFPGTDGLLHISELADRKVATVEEVVREGDEVIVKVLSIDRNGKIRLSRKAAIGQQVSD